MVPTFIATLAVVVASGLIGGAAHPAAERLTANAQDGREPTLVERFLRAPDAPLTSYRAFRTLEAESRGGKMRAHLSAWTWLDPEKGLQYRVVDEGGSGLIRDKVLRAALHSEQALRASGEVDRGALTSANYEFGVPQPPQEGWVRVEITPRRRETLLIAGSVVLAAADGDLARVEGFLVKRPSFWTREVHVVRRYGRIAGVRVPLSMESTARVLVAGRSSFSMRYEYVEINGVHVGAGPSSMPSSDDDAAAPGGPTGGGTGEP